MKMSGLSAEELYAAELIPGCRAAFSAWLHLAQHSSWLRAFSGSTILERANNNAVVKGGGVSVRSYARFTEDVVKLLGDVKGHDVHNVADEEHSDMMEDILDRYLKTEEDCREVLLGARDSLDFDRAFRGSLAVYLENIGE
jgi:pyrroloquinoline quinone (PQQ) biosynthesis protein C